MIYNENIYKKTFFIDAQMQKQEKSVYSQQLNEIENNRGE